jgi:5'-nucleotidase
MKNFIISLFIILFIVSCKNEPQQLIKIEGKLLPINQEIEPIKEIEDFIEPYKQKVATEMNTVLSYTKIDLVRTDSPLESSLGNLMGDLCYQRANPVFNSRTGKNIDFALFNYGGLRAGISKGDVTMEHAFNLMPFENGLVVVELTTEKIKELVAYLIEGNRAHPLSKHFNLAVTNTGYSLKINNKPLQENSTYYVLTSDYLQNGGDRMNFFKDPVSITNIDYKFRNAIIDYFKETDTLKTNLDGRFRKEN